MDNSTGAESPIHQVKFFPPLHEQRRSWALEILRRERVTSMLDVGCGEGVLLQHLTHAAPWRAYTPATPAPSVFEKPEFIHPRALHGLDIVHDDLLYAIDVTGPPKHTYGWTRFEPLDVSIWEGGLQMPNPAFQGIECIVATEVVEHLPQDTLEAFAPVLLGSYSPRLLLLTTPSYDFNERFRAPGDESWGFKDPTGNTSRTFRHLDHKFEWTVEECTQWCKAAAQEWGYEVVIDGIGRSITEDAWGRDNNGVRASQAVTFRRREGEEWATKRAAKFAAWASRRAQESQPHQLLSTHRFDAHDSAQKPAPREEIIDAVKTTIIQDLGTPQVTIFEIWRDDAVSTACAGWLEVLLEVLEQEEAFVLHRDGKAADDWKVELPGVELQGRNPWQSTARNDDAWGSWSESTDTEPNEDEEDYTSDDDEGYDGQSWEQTEDSGWAMSETEGWNTEEDINMLKAWGDWKPAPGWLAEAGWD